MIKYNNQYDVTLDILKLSESVLKNNLPREALEQTNCIRDLDQAIKYLTNCIKMLERVVSDKALQD